MAAGDRERWNERYAAEQETPAPTPFLVSLGAILPRRGRALDLAGGSGRNALWLALSTVLVDLEAEPPPAGPWDLVVCTYFLNRPLLGALPALLAPGGLLVVAHATRTNLTRHPRPGPDHVLEDGELPALVRGVELLHVEEGWLESGRHEARLVGRSRDPN